MLRGWDEGFSIPSLGIAIDPSARGLHLGRAFMHFLHFVAKRRGCSLVRLTVSQTNHSAIKLYEGLGYKLEVRVEGDLLGTLELTNG
jgi:ribosomal protein S18 acetylase RimI-like enzyme